MAETIYLLCALTSLACAALLLRGYRRGGGRLLLWSTGCFFFLAVNNVLLVVDLVLVPTMDLSPLRSGAGLVAISLLLFGLIWDGR
ncbi:MAG: DUF5985 family protein [Candidatus Rokuibacteriota bacterium]